MDNLICGLVGLFIVAFFLGGLAVSIGSIPFGIITVSVLGMASYDFIESVRTNRRSSNGN